jgi:hypothetical protein
MFLKKKVIIRTFSAGVHYGTLIERSEKEVLLGNAKRIWNWSGALTLHEMALFGLDKSSRVSAPIEAILLTEVIEILPCTTKAAQILDSQGWEKSVK